MGTAHRQRVREAFEDENDYAAQSATYKNADGPDAIEVAFAEVAWCRPRTILDVGCGPGTFAERLSRELQADVITADLSPRMAAVTAARGIPAMVAEVEALPLASRRVDCVVANWIFHYCEDVNAGLREVARILRPGGTLVAATPSERHLSELWELLFGVPAIVVAFSRENGRRRLKRHFQEVARRDADGHVTFPNWTAVHDFLGRTMGGERLASSLPRFEGPFVASKRSSVFVARR